MTNNQIEYAKHTENIRHNLAVEGLTRDTLSETTRHNRAGEQISRDTVKVSQGNLDELRRHNVQTENLSATQILNNYTVGLKQAAAAQTSASAAMKQAGVAENRQIEDARHNEKVEGIQLVDIYRKYDQQAKELEEQQRHNKANEALTAGNAFLNAANGVLGQVTNMPTQVGKILFG